MPAWRAPWIVDDARDVVAALPVAELLHQPVIAEHLAMVGGDDHDRVVPHPEVAQALEQPAELVVDLADQPP